MNSDYCMSCKRGSISQEDLEMFRSGEDEGFTDWCRIRRIHGSKGLDWTKATGQDIKDYFHWENDWAEAGIPG